MHRRLSGRPCRWFVWIKSIYLCWNWNYRYAWVSQSRGGEYSRSCFGSCDPVPCIFSGYDAHIQRGEHADGKNRNTITIKMPADGKIKPMSEAQDEVFASETLGKGCVVQSDDGKVYAPVNGTITTLFPTKHAIGITSSDGVEVLIHIGINTVALEGKYFEEKVKQGDHVATGQLLMCFDKEVIEKEGYSTEIPLVITNTADYLDVVELEHKHYKHGEEILKIFS